MQKKDPCLGKVQVTQSVTDFLDVRLKDAKKCIQETFRRKAWKCRAASSTDLFLLEITSGPVRRFFFRQFIF